MGNLGFFDAESYGLTWKVRGLCTKSGKLENVDIFDKRNVYGDIINSDIYGARMWRIFLRTCVSLATLPCLLGMLFVLW